MSDLASISPEFWGVLYNTPSFAPPNGTTSNFDDPPNKNGTVAVVIVCVILATISIVLRTISRLGFQKKVEVQDVLGVLSYCFFIGSVWSILEIHQTIGLFVHQWNVRLLDLVHFSYCAHILQVLYSFAMLFGKSAILVDWVRIFSPRGIHNMFFWCSAAIICLNSLLYATAIIVLNLGCSPMEKIWHFWLDGSCINRSALGLATSSINCVIDLSMFMLPQRSIWKLKLPARRKIGLAVTFSLGVLACAGAIGRVAATSKIDPNGEQTYIATAIMIASIVELTCMILIFCLPTIPKIFLESTAIFKMHGYVGIWFSMSRKSQNNGLSGAQTPSQPIRLVHIPMKFKIAPEEKKSIEVMAG